MPNLIVAQLPLVPSRVEMMNRKKKMNFDIDFTICHDKQTQGEWNMGGNPFINEPIQSSEFDSVGFLGVPLWKHWS